MGLDIEAYTNLELVQACDDRLDGFEGSNREYIFVKVWGVDRLGGMTPGYYRSDDYYSFRAGSYGGYNDWRNHLCKLINGMEDKEMWAGWQDAEAAGEDPHTYLRGHPFAELICFSDCEGIIGTSVCAKLHKDFVEYHELVQQLSPDNRWFYKYEEWMHAFERASQNNGIIKFC